MVPGAVGSVVGARTLKHTVGLSHADFLMLAVMVVLVYHPWCFFIQLLCFNLSFLV